MFFTSDNTYNNIREECLKGCISKEDEGAIKIIMKLPSFYSDIIQMFLMYLPFQCISAKCNRYIN